MKVKYRYIDISPELAAAKSRAIHRIIAQALLRQRDRKEVEAKDRQKTIEYNVVNVAAEVKS